MVVENCELERCPGAAVKLLDVSLLRKLGAAWGIGSRVSEFRLHLCTPLFGSQNKYGVDACKRLNENKVLLNQKQSTGLDKPCRYQQSILPNGPTQIRQKAGVVGISRRVVGGIEPACQL